MSSEKRETRGEEEVESSDAIIIIIIFLMGRDDIGRIKANDAHVMSEYLHLKLLSDEIQKNISRSLIRDRWGDDATKKN